MYIYTHILIGLRQAIEHNNSKAFEIFLIICYIVHICYWNNDNKFSFHTLQFLRIQITISFL